DGDGDSITRSASIPLVTASSSVLSFDDDGPTQSVAVAGQADLAGLAVTLDETQGASDHYADGESPDSYSNDDHGHL
ncbi:hypothetical protein, partial [Aeromonas simiae]